MKMEDHFKETLNRAVANEPPVLDAWQRFEGRARRDRRVRLFASVAAAAAAVVAAAIVVPQLTRDRSLEPVVPGPTPSGTVDPYAGWETLLNPSQRYLVRFPADWTTSTFEGVQSFQPPGVEPVEKGEPTFFVSIKLSDEQPCPPSEDIQRMNPGWECGTAPGGVAREDGRTYLRLENREGDAHVVTYMIDWTPKCPDDPECGVAGRSLVAIARGDTDGFWSKYSDLGLRIIESIRYRYWPNNEVTETCPPGAQPEPPVYVC